MRYSYYKKLINEERRQRGPHYVHQARLRQLTILTCALLGIYVICTYNIWHHPRPIHHVWIDDVLVEVIEENWIDRARSGLFYVGLCCAGLLGLLRLCFGWTSSSSSMSEAASSAKRSEGVSTPYQQESGSNSHRENMDQTSQKDISTIAVPAWARRRSAGQPPRSSFEGPRMSKEVSAAAAAAADVADFARAFDARRPMRSDKDLNFFLAYEAAHQQQQRQRHSSGDSFSMRYRGATVADDAFYQNEADPAARDALNVTYEYRGIQRGDVSGCNRLGGGVDSAGRAAFGSSAGLACPPSSLPWAELGILHLEEALQRTREWMSDVCHHLVDDIDQCDRWFSEHQIEMYDCHHSLQELLPAPAAAPAMGIPSAPGRTGGWWGANNTTGTNTTAGFVAPAANPQLETKLNAVLREKANCRQAQQSIQDLDVALRFDQRLTLEAQLDVTGTFPSSPLVRPSNAELTATREYVIDRLRTFAKQRFLVSYNPAGGDAETWRGGYPCDAHLLLHVLRASVKGLSEYVRFGYQTGTQTQDLVLYVGDTGEPYFYVRFRQGSGETLLSTRQGPTSLMEAVLAFAAVIHTYYRDVFGGIRGTVDLSEVGLLKVVTEGRRPAWGLGSG